MYDIIIVGGGPAGLTAGLYAVRAGAKALLLEGGMMGGQAVTTNWIENYPGFAAGVGGPELSMAMTEQAEKQGLEIRYAPVEAFALQEDPKRVSVEGEWLEGRSVILCMGATSRRTNAQGEETYTGRGVSWCATCDGAFYRNQPVAILGGGNTAAEEALYLANVASHVTLVHRRDRLRADEVLSQKVLAHPKIEVRWHCVVEAFEGEKKLERICLRNVTTNQTEMLAVAAAFVAIGKTPDTALVENQVERDAQGFLIAGENTHTNIPGVFAAGDLRTKSLRQVVTAVADGAVSATEAMHWLQTRTTLPETE